MVNSSKSNTYEQRKAEANAFVLVQKWLEEEHPGIQLMSNPQIPIGKTFIQPDFYAKSEGIIGEIFSHIGNTKRGQDNKISNDILKMLLLEKVEGRTYKKIIVVCNDAIEAKLTGTSYSAEFIRQFGIILKKIELDNDLRCELMRAQDRQKMVNP